jgi:hypothetical protein
MPLRIENAVDLHCHYAPDTLGGGLDFGVDFEAIPAIETAREAVDNGYAAIVLKSHSFASPHLARNLELAVPDLRIFGGICTDYPTGGLNVYAVEAALTIGAKIVWLPTVHGSVDFSSPKYPRAHRHAALGPIRVVDDSGALLSEVHEIFDLVKEKDALLATGHISTEEHVALIREFGHSGRILVTHADEARGGAALTPQQCAEFADLGATIEFTALTCEDVMGEPGRPPEQLLAFLRAVGPERSVLSTDYGWTTSGIPRPASGLLEFLDVLWKIGVPEEDLARMASKNPGRLLELPFV